MRTKHKPEKRLIKKPSTGSEWPFFGTFLFSGKIHVEIMNILKFFSFPHEPRLGFPFPSPLFSRTKSIFSVLICVWKRERSPGNGKWSKEKSTRKRCFRGNSIRFRGSKKGKLSTRKNDFNLMFNGFLFIFLIRRRFRSFSSECFHSLRFWIFTSSVRE